MLTAQGTLQKSGGREGAACEIVRAGHKGWDVGGDKQEEVTAVDPKLDPGNQRLLTPPLSL